MQILKNPNFDFMKYRHIWLAISFVTILGGMVGIFFLDRLNFGVDFAGGTQLTVKFHESPDVEQLRSLVVAAGFKESVIQRFGEAGANEVIIRTRVVGGSEEGSAKLIVPALDQRYNGAQPGVDLNQVGSVTIAQILSAANPDGVAPDDLQAHYAGVAEAIMAERKKVGLFSSWDQIQGVAGLSSGAFEKLKSSAHLGAFSVLGIENVGPQVGKELRKRGVFAVVGAMLGMLAYIWFRFELRFGVGATMATLHDVLITLGVFAWAGFEFNLTSVAAFLTLIGYSVNDTVVTFDRVRENMRKSRSQPLIDVLNRSVNQTLSRTILTGGTTILASLALFLFGGDVIHGFAFVMTIGVVVGTYSSIYIASPFALLWETWFGAGGKLRRSSQPAARRA